MSLKGGFVMNEKCENKKCDNCTKVPYMWNGFYPTYPMAECMWGINNPGYMWQNMPRRCPCCGGIMPFGGYMGYMGECMSEEKEAYPECN
jgi:hypothetical protein